MRDEIIIKKWVVERFISWSDCAFDTCILILLWFLQWKTAFWVYVVIAIISTIGHGTAIAKLDKELGE